VRMDHPHDTHIDMTWSGAGNESCENTTRASRVHVPHSFDLRFVNDGNLPFGFLRIAPPLVFCCMVRLFNKKFTYQKGRFSLDTSRQLAYLYLPACGITWPTETCERGQWPDGRSHAAIHSMSAAMADLKTAGDAVCVAIASPTPSMF
jgi:hypothetical protein